MFAESVRPLVRKHFKKVAKKACLVVRTVGISEPDIMKKLGKDFFAGPGPKAVGPGPLIIEEPFDFGIYPEPGEVSLRLYARDSKTLSGLKRKARERLGPWVYAYEEGSLAEVIARLLVKKRKSLAVAESCTGGLLASEICRIPGASRYFRGGVVAYDNAIKMGFLEVPGKVLNRDGAVSRPAALRMAEGVRRKMNADFGLSVTGIAGPSGQTKAKPVGLVYCGLATPRGTRSLERIFWGDRRQIQNKAVKKALELLWRELKD